MAVLGESAGEDAADSARSSGVKPCGPLLPPLLAEITSALQRQRKAGGSSALELSSWSPVVSALSGPRLAEWHQRYFGALLRSFSAHHTLAKESEERLAFVTALIGSWAAAWAELMHSAPTAPPAAARCSTLVADLTEFRALASPTGPLFAQIFAALNPSGRQMAGRRGAAFSVIATAEMSSRHKLAMAKLEAFLATQVRKGEEQRRDNRRWWSGVEGLPESSGMSGGFSCAGRQKLRRCMGQTHGRKSTVEFDSRDLIVM